MKINKLALLLVSMTTILVCRAEHSNVRGSAATSKKSTLTTHDAEGEKKNASNKARKAMANFKPGHLPIPATLQSLPARNKNNNAKFDLSDHGSIVGGTEVLPDVYKWFARATLNNGGGSYDWAGCGGSLVSKDFVLTAAHCIYSTFEQVGGYDIGALCPLDYPNNCEQHYEHREIKAVFTHPNYNGGTLDNDFALVQLESPVLSIEPVPLDDGSVSPNLPSGAEVTAIGLGTLFSGGPPSDVLLDVDVNYITNVDCNSNYGGAITDAMMCAADVDQDSCQGDSGGPLFHKASNTQVGVVSWGYGCADDNYPGVYSRISDEKAWIDETICCNADPENRPDFCAANINCGGSGGGGGGGTSCTNVPDWTDLAFGDDCSWYENNEPEGCPNWGEELGTGNLTANAACCHCGGGNIEGTCSDVEGWYDSDGVEFNCEWYTDKQNCQLYGGDFGNMGHTANTACCVCGGGEEKICTDEPGWHDSDGAEFDCAWYADKQNCQLYGGQYANNGMTAQDACCVCGGGSTGSTPSGDFTITLMNMGTNTEFDQAFQNAKARWESLVTNDLLDVPSGFAVDLFDGVFVGSSVDVAVDDVLIGYEIAPIDGPDNILGMAGPTYARDNGDNTPASTIAGVMMFDSADFGNMPAEDAEVIIMHEMGHVLGIGTFWSFKCGTACGFGDHSYTCAKALTEYANLNTGGGLLLENDGGQGTACGHWDEASFADGASSELMTGYFESHLAQPLSKVTAAALEDLGGYVVDYSAADPYPGTASGTNQATVKVLASETTFSLDGRIEQPKLHTVHLS